MSQSLNVPERIKKFNSDRVAEFLSLKYAKMAENPFRFFRGTCHLFYEDLSAHHVLPAEPVCWICGDLHVENFGSYKGDNRLVYFDVNDFDEGVLAPVSWELARMTTSIFLSLAGNGYALATRKKMSRLFLEKYSQVLASGKSRYIEPQVATGVVKYFLEKVERRKQKALVKQRTHKIKDRIVLLEDSLRVFPVRTELKKQLTAILSAWARKKKYIGFSIPDIGFRIAGTGSIGVERYIFLAEQQSKRRKYLLLDMKEAKPSAILPYLKVEQPSWNSESERVIAIQQRMQNVVPALLDSIPYNGKSYVLKELQPTEDKIDFSVLGKKPGDLDCVISDMGILAASAHLRSSGRQGSAIADELVAFGSGSTWQNSILDYAEASASGMNRAYRTYLTAYRKGYFDTDKKKKEG